MSEPFLEVENLSKHFAVRKGLWSHSAEVIKAVDGVSFSMKKGEILGLVGESGCGKSTLSRLIMQLIPPTTGKVTLEGQCLTTLPAEEVRRRRIDFQMVFQDPYASLNPRMTVYSALSEAIRTRRPACKRQALVDLVAEHMTRVGLEPRFMQKYPHEFSGGQRQRIAVARAIATEPKLVIADEPVSALDVSVQSQLLNLLTHLSQTLELSMLFVSHDLAVVHYIADRIAVMNEGRFVEVGEASRVFHDPREDYTKRLLDAIPHPPVMGGQG